MKYSKRKYFLQETAGNLETVTSFPLERPLCSDSSYPITELLNCLIVHVLRTKHLILTFDWRSLHRSTCLCFCIWENKTKQQRQKLTIIVMFENCVNSFLTVVCTQIFTPFLLLKLKKSLKTVY